VSRSAQVLHVYTFVGVGEEKNIDKESIALQQENEARSLGYRVGRFGGELEETAQAAARRAARMVVVRHEDG
jgi:hypothetical protein